MQLQACLRVVVTSALAVAYGQVNLINSLINEEKRAPLGSVPLRVSDVNNGIFCSTASP